MRRDNRWGFYRYEEATPREVKGGIKADVSRRGAERNWWSDLWIRSLEMITSSARLQRGRRYAKKGQVASLLIESGHVEAEVQGTRATPYTVSMELQTIPEEGWIKIEELMRKNPRHLALLLSGEMPGDMQDIFEEAGYSLFPGSNRDLRTDCSCPDSSNPCKHIAAVHYILAGELDRDPFLLLRLRGRERADFCASFDGWSQGESSGTSVAEEKESKPIPVDPGAYWSEGVESYKPLLDANKPDPSAILRELGPFPLWRGDDDLLESLEGIYKEASERALDLLTSDRSDGTS